MFSIIVLGILLLSFLSINVCAASERILEQNPGDYYPASEAETQYSIGDWITMILGILTIVVFISFLILTFIWNGIKKKDKLVDRLFSSSMIFIIVTLIAVIVNSMFV